MEGNSASEKYESQSTQEKRDSFLEEVAISIKREKKINRKLANFMLAGLPGNGKTAFLDRLLGRPVHNHYLSTSIADDIAVVDANAIVDVDSVTTDFHAVFTYDDMSWKLLESLDSSFLKQMESLGDITEVGLKNQSCIQKDDELTASSSSFKPLVSDSLYRCVAKVLQPFKMTDLHDLEIKSTYYFRDVGGQMEFQECISLFIYGPSIFMFVFNASIDIETRQKVRYRIEENVIINEYESSISTKNALLQCLASISAMETTDYSADSVTPLVIIVGTHRDLLGPYADNEIEKIDKKLDVLIRSNNFQKFVQYANVWTGKVVFFVNNKSKKTDDVMKVRNQIDRIVSRNEFTIEFPISYLLICLELQTMTSKTVLTLNEFKNIAAKYEIKDDLVKNLLRFLHFRVGIVQYFDVDGLRELVVMKPQILFRKVTDLVEKTFLSSGALKSNEEEEFRKKGILEAEVFETILNENDNLSSEQFIKFLLHLRMMVSFVGQAGEKKYFIPAVLNHAPKPPDEENSEVSSLYITFGCGHSPKGLFGMLVTHLMSPDDKTSEQRAPFKLLDEQIYQDQIAFKVHLNDKVILKMHPSHFEVKFFPGIGKCDVPYNVPVSQRCISVRMTIEQFISNSLTYLHYSAKKTEATSSLRCKSDTCNKLHKVQQTLEGNCIMECEYSSYILPAAALFWYCEGMVNLIKCRANYC